VKPEAVLAAGLLFQLAVTPRKGDQVCVYLDEEVPVATWREWTGGVRFGYREEGEAVAICLSNPSEVIEDPEHPLWDALATLAGEALGGASKGGLQG